MSAPGRALLSVAPMMDWTDRLCRGFHRVLSARALLYTEMVTAPAVIHGPRARLLERGATGPVALQLGGSDPGELAQAVRLALPYGYDEINLNCGCPSDRVQSGCFGAVLMERPALVAEICRAMIAESPVPVTVKCRIGVDDQDPAEALPRFLEAVTGAGVGHVIIHARKAWLQGLSPRENREIPPLDHALALAMKARFPELSVSVNGGVTSLDQARDLLAQGFDGVMVGRAAYHDPAAILGAADSLWGDPAGPDPVTVALRMRAVIADHLAAGGRMHQITRHMLGLFAGRPGARAWRRLLSEGAGEGLAAYDRALEAVSLSAAA
jgi:tRNA-dihydrouridine synthase A